MKKKSINFLSEFADKPQALKNMIAQNNILEPLPSFPPMADVVPNPLLDFLKHPPLGSFDTANVSDLHKNLLEQYSGKVTGYAPFNSL